MLRMLKTNPRRNPSLRWTEGIDSWSTQTGREQWEHIKFERTDALGIPQITITHPRLGSGPAGTGLFQGTVEEYLVKPRRGAAARIEFSAYFNLFLPYEVAANRANFQKLEDAHVGFSARFRAENPSYLNRRASEGLSVMARRGQEEAVGEYRIAELNLAMFDDGTVFATRDEAKAWIQSKVDVLSRMTLERPSGL